MRLRGEGMAYLWGGMIVIGIIYGTLTGNIDGVSKALVSCAGEGVNLYISMAGITAMWTGIMKIAESAGLVSGLAGRMKWMIRFLFPGLDADSKAAHYICLNFLSNMLGLSWASTSSGLCAMEELSARSPGTTASDEMCTFLIINVSSLQLIPVNMIAYRAKYGSVDPTAIVGPAILATAVSTAVAVIFCKVMQRIKHNTTDRIRQK